MPPKLTVRKIAFSERPVSFRVPYVYGNALIHGAPEVFVHAEIEVDGRRAVGATAELLSPNWFIKEPVRGDDQTFNQLRCALRFARDIYLEHGRADTAFGLHAAGHERQRSICAAHGITPLVAAFGAAELDKAILDALLRALGLDVFTGLNRNVVGLDARLTPDLEDAALAEFLAGRKPAPHILVRHTIGVADRIDALDAVIRDTGCRYFKVKLGGDPASDCARLIGIAAELKKLDIDYRMTLDANEQYADHPALAALIDGLLHDEALEPVVQRLLYIEQPFRRDATWTMPLGDLGKSFAFIIDEADCGYESFPAALALGYRGISVKGGKGIYKGLLNAARCTAMAAQGTRAFVTAEDLTCQAGLAVQQDTALAAFLGMIHAERNGHKYADGFAAAPAAEARLFSGAHPDFYAQSGEQVRLAIRDGALAVGSLRQPGFACAVDPARVGQASAALQSPAKKKYGT
jgi:hypothetical protein